VSFCVNQCRIILLYPFARLRVWITFVDKKTVHFRNISITFRSKSEKNRKKRSKPHHPILPKLTSRKKILPILPILTHFLRDSVPPPLNFLLKIPQKSSQPFMNQHLNNPKQLSPNKNGTVPNKADFDLRFHPFSPKLTDIIHYHLMDYAKRHMFQK